MMNQKGFISIDFMFAFVICFAMSAIIFSFTVTLTVVEIAQYIVFSTSRAATAAHVNVEEQEKLGRNKYSSLLNDRVFKSLFSNGWFSLSKVQELELRMGSGVNYESDYPSKGNANRSIFHGARSTFSAPILNMNLPFIGGTDPEDAGFKAKIAAILFRNPSQKECQDFMAARLNAIWALEGNRGIRFKGNSSGPTPFEDNGC
jgi:hypothetical protein